MLGYSTGIDEIESYLERTFSPFLRAALNRVKAKIPDDAETVSTKVVIDALWEEEKFVAKLKLRFLSEEESHDPTA